MTEKVRGFTALVVLEGESLMEFAMTKAPELLTPEFQDVKRFVEQIVRDGEGLLELHGAPLSKVDAQFLN